MITCSDSEVSTSRWPSPPICDCVSSDLAWASKSGFSNSSISSQEPSNSESSGGGSGFLNSDTGGKS
ncbi:MAG: hypothetical protein ACKO3V_06010, partial [Pirellula sp.]